MNALCDQWAEELNDEQLESMARRLEKSPNFKILRKFQAVDSFGDIGDEKTGSVCVIDFETTGVEESDRPIEIGMLCVEYGRVSGRLGKILGRYSAFEDPGIELPEHIVALTGITDSDVSGKRFDEDAVREIVEKSSLIVAHHAEFDRMFAEQRFDCMRKKAWACSLKDVPWSLGDIGSGKLEFVGLKMGWFYNAHRALDDCELTAGVLNKVLCADSVAMKFLLDKARREHYRVWATGAHYRTKNLLSRRGYAWRNVPGTDEKAWRTETMDPYEEVDWLRDNVYRNGGNVLLELVGRSNRFTDRSEKVEVVSL